MRMMRATGSSKWHVAAEVVSRGLRTGKVHGVYHVTACTGASLCNFYGPVVTSFTPHERETIGSHSDNTVCRTCAERFLPGEKVRV